MRPIMLSFLGGVLATAAGGHEIVVKPSTADGALTLAIESTHVFVAPEEREGVEAVAASLTPQGGARVAMTVAEAGALSLAATGPAPEGPAWAVAHRLPQVWSNTPDGWKPGAHDDAAFTNRYEKFAKALLNADAADPEFVTTPLGHALEIIPMDNPADLRAGDELRVKVLLNGEPVATEVKATFDGFSDAPMTFAYATETQDHAGEPGVARIRLWSPGYWYVRAAVDADDAEADAHVLRAIMSFDVR